MKQFEAPQADNDNELASRLISRRSALRLFGAAACTSTLFLSGTQAQTSNLSGALPTCIVRPVMTEGMYFVDEKLNRSDIRSDPATKTIRPGAPLRLTFRVSSVGNKGCQPLSGAMIDIWHCDASGTYSDVRGAVGQKFLRGYQITNVKGIASFLTIYPGWYPGRTVHVHFKIRHSAGGIQTEFTSQLFFNDNLTDAVFQAVPYNARGARNTRNANDVIYRNGGNQLLLDTKADGKGYAATFDIGLNLG
jgi:protocatechuate 3,4-dioxygenase beta subunit